MNSNQFAALNGQGLKIAVAAARFNQDLTDAMLADCEAALRACGVAEIRSVRVPGSFELPVAAAKLAAQGYDAVVCLGVIIKGDTRHDEFIAVGVSNGLTAVSVQHKIPVLFGVLTTENRAQAEARALGEGKKGWEAGMSAVETVLSLR